MKTNLLYALLGLLWITGCSKSEEKETEPDRLCYLQEEVFISGPADNQRIRKISYSYNDQNQLISHTPGDQIFGTGQTRYSYDAAGKLISVAYLDGKDRLTEYTESKYDDRGLVVRQILYSNTGVERSYTDYTYDNQNTLLESKEYYEVDGVMTMLYHNIYTFQNGNMTKLVTYNESDLRLWEVIMGYDNRKSPFWALPALRAQRIFDGFPHERNILHYTERNIHGKVVELRSYTSTINYTPEGYPQEEIITYGNGGKVRKLYTYVCP